MNQSFKKLFAIGCGLPVAFLILGFMGIFFSALKEYDYSDISYVKDYSWKDVEVGTVLRLPRGSLIPNGRYSAVIAFKMGQSDDARILLSGPKAEVAKRPTLISTNEQMVVYRTHEGDTKIDLSNLISYPTRRSSSSQNLNIEGTP